GLEAGDRPQEAALAAPARADQGDDLARGHGERGNIHRGDPVEADGDVLDRQAGSRLGERTVEAAGPDGHHPRRADGRSRSSTSTRRAVGTARTVPSAIAWPWRASLGRPRSRYMATGTVGLSGRVRNEVAPNS